MYVEARKRLVDWLRRQPIGTAGESSLDMSPRAVLDGLETVFVDTP